MIADTNEIIRTYLIGQATLTTVVGTKIFCPRLPEDTSLPALGFFTRGGSSTPFIPPLVEPSIQFDCWGTSPQEARNLYRKLYDVLQGIQNVNVVIAPTTYRILSAVEEVHGQDVQSQEYPNYHRVVAFFKMMIQVE